MKKEKIKGLIAGVLIGATVAGGATFAASTTNLYDVIANGVKIVVDGQQINPTDVNGNRVEPFIYNGTTYLPVRAVASALGKEVYWDGPNYTVYLGDMGGKLEYPSAYIKDVTNIGDAGFYTKDHMYDNYGNSYNSVLYYYNRYNSSTAEFLLNMKYSRFKGTIAIMEGTNSSYEGKIIIMADDKEIYTSPILTRSSSPIPIDINIRGCNSLKIKFDGFLQERVFIGNAGFYQ